MGGSERRKLFLSGEISGAHAFQQARSIIEPDKSWSATCYQDRDCKGGVTIRDWLCDLGPRWIPTVQHSYAWLVSLNAHSTKGCLSKQEGASSPFFV